MDEQLKNIGKNIVEFWKNLSKKVKIIIISAASVLIIGAIILAVILNKTNYVVLFSNLSQEEATEVMGKLQEKEVSYEYNKNGEILVNEKDEALLRMQLAQEGYPRSGLNYDIFTNNVDFMTTDFEKRTFLMLQLQERIQTSIKTLSGIKDAIVTLSIPEENNFAWDTEEKESSASVVITIVPGYKLTTQQVQGIKQLVEKSVLGLKSENISIVDNDGNDLVSDSDMLQTDTIKLKLEVEKQIQKDIENNIKKILEKPYGKDNVEVSAKCTMNLDKKISENLQYIPDKDSNTGVVSNKNNNVEIVGDGTVEGGVTGTETNSEVPIYPDVTINGNDIYYKDSSAINYLVSQLKEQVQHEPGTIENLSVAVIINKDKISDEEKNEIKNLVAYSAGITTDKVALHNMEFKQAIVDVFDDEGDLKPLSDREKLIYIAIGVGALLVLVVIIIIISKIRKRKRLKKEQELLAAQEAEKPEGGTWDDIKDEIELKETKESVLKKQIAEFASNNPEIAAQLIRTWLKGDDD